MLIQLRLTSRELLERLSDAQLLPVRRFGIKTLFEIRAAVPYTPATPGVRVLNDCTRITTTHLSSGRTKKHSPWRSF